MRYRIQSTDAGAFFLISLAQAKAIVNWCARSQILFVEIWKPFSMVECCFRNINTNKPYSQLRIGDAWGLLKKYHSEKITNLVSTFIKWSNEFSHDTGVEVNKSKAQSAVSIIQEYVILFREEIALDYLQPIWREKEYIAF